MFIPKAIGCSGIAVRGRRAGPVTTCAVDPEGIEALSDLRERLQGPRTRFRERSKVEQAMAEILAAAEARSWLLVEIEEQEEETFRQATRGRPSEQTKYLKETRSRFTLTWKLNVEAISEAEREDGVFPLLTNDRKLSATKVSRLTNDSRSWKSGSPNSRPTSLWPRSS